jgi:hypothetical protein
MHCYKALGSCTPVQSGNAEMGAAVLNKPPTGTLDMAQELAAAKAEVLRMRAQMSDVRRILVTAVVLFWSESARLLDS